MDGPRVVVCAGTRLDHPGSDGGNKHGSRRPRRAGPPSEAAATCGSARNSKRATRGGARDDAVRAPAGETRPCELDGRRVRRPPHNTRLHRDGATRSGPVAPRPAGSALLAGRAPTRELKRAPIAVAAASVVEGSRSTAAADGGRAWVAGRTVGGTRDVAQRSEERPRRPVRRAGRYREARVPVAQAGRCGVVRRRDVRRPSRRKSLRCHGMEGYLRMDIGERDVCTGRPLSPSGADARAARGHVERRHSVRARASRTAADRHEARRTAVDPRRPAGRWADAGPTRWQPNRAATAGATASCRPTPGDRPTSRSMARQPRHVARRARGRRWDDAIHLPPVCTRPAARTYGRVEARIRVPAGTGSGQRWAGGSSLRQRLAGAGEIDVGLDGREPRRRGNATAPDGRAAYSVQARSAPASLTGRHTYGAYGSPEASHHRQGDATISRTARRNRAMGARSLSRHESGDRRAVGGRRRRTSRHDARDWVRVTSETGARGTTRER